MSALNNKSRGPAAARRLVKARPGRLFRLVVEALLLSWAIWETLALTAEAAEPDPDCNQAAL